MTHGDRCLLVHGHFYQPPRENPWTGRIDPQASAAPWENWNRRIADDCYLPMARSRVYDPDGRIEDLYNNYAHTSFNFGPTLLSWLDDTHPSLLRHLADATVIDRTFAMAQVYNHMILPLADSRDRHTQIVWGLREFSQRFGFPPEGMWLSECAICPETVRALIDHNVRYVILSPHQASRARPFGDPHWHDVSMGSIDTRRGYRLFDIDGGGRTHFDRFLNVVFYTPGLNLKVSFDHILNRPDDLRRELEQCYLRDYDGRQLVSIVTDGEIYGHHEKHGEEALSRLYRDIAPSLGLKVVSAGEFLRDDPPAWEVKLWNGEDGLGSSWSCQHGVGRWRRDCGCRPPAPAGWTQSWRGPLRGALDALRDRVRFVARRELGRLVLDGDDALGDYISVVLDPGPAARRAFLARHAQRRLTAAEAGRLWAVLEALRNAMLMYTSCGWFFDEVSGLEPVQNMRYALRAAELIQPWHDEDLTALLEEKLGEAKSNIPQCGDGGKVFRDLVLPSRHSNHELAAAVAVCLAADFPQRGVDWRLVEATRTEDVSEDGKMLFRGAFVCHDPCLDRFIKTSWQVTLTELDEVGVTLADYAEAQGDPGRPAGDSPFRLDEGISWSHADACISLDRLPGAVRHMVYRRFAMEEEEKIDADSVELGCAAAPFVRQAHRHGESVPGALRRLVTDAASRKMAEKVHGAVARMSFAEAAAQDVEDVRRDAWGMGLDPDSGDCRLAVQATALELLHWLAQAGEHDWLDTITPLLTKEGPWLRPRAPANHIHATVSATLCGRALGKGLARLGEDADTEGDALERSLLVLRPLEDILAYACELDLNPQWLTLAGIAYWDYLGTPLARLVREAGAGILEEEFGRRLQRAGELLGFRPETIAARLEKAAGTAASV